MSSLTVLLAMALGALSYHLSQQLVLEHRQKERKTFMDSVEFWRGDHHIMGYMISALAMVIGLQFTVNLVPPMGWNDPYALLLIGGIMGFMATSLVLLWTDFQEMFLPTRVIYSGGFTSLAFLIAAAASKGLWGLLVTMLLSGLAFGLIYGAIWFTWPSGFGFGDVRLAPFLGAFLGFFSVQTAMVGFVGAWALMILAILVMLPFGILDKNFKFPIGPWLLIGGYIGLFYGETIMNAVLG